MEKAWPFVTEPPESHGVSSAAQRADDKPAQIHAEGNGPHLLLREVSKNFQMCFDTACAWNSVWQQENLIM